MTDMTAQSPIPQAQMSARRASARRTALLFAAIAFAVYAGFIVLNAVAK
jgi:hypothetical protein